MRGVDERRRAGAFAVDGTHATCVRPDVPGRLSPPAPRKKLHVERHPA